MEVLRSIKEFLSKIFKRRQAIKNTVIGLTPATVVGNSLVKSVRGKIVDNDNVQTDTTLPEGVRNSSKNAYDRAHAKAQKGQGNVRRLGTN